MDSLFAKSNTANNLAMQGAAMVGGVVLGILLKQKLALASAAFYKRKTPDPGSYVQPNLELMKSSRFYIPISTKTQESYQLQAEITQHAIEDASIVSDHVILRPIRIDLSGSVANWNGPSDASDCLNALFELWKAREPVTVQTLHRSFDNMICVAIQADNTVPLWGTLDFKASFQQISLLKLESGKYQPVASKSAPEPKKAVQPNYWGEKQPKAKTL
jgi:hypothetical protein